jgi:beta-lactamase class A
VKRVNGNPSGTPSRILTVRRLVVTSVLRTFVLAMLGCQPLPRAEVVEHLSRVNGRVSVTVRDVATGEGWDLRGDEPFAAGDTITVFVLSELFRQVEAGTASLDERLSLAGEPSGPREGPGTRLGLLSTLHSVTEMSVGDLAVLALSQGDPTAVNLLIDRLGLENVNSTAQALGAERTRIERKLGYSAPPENYTTARDLVTAWRALAGGEDYSARTRNTVASVLRASRISGRQVSAGLAAADLRISFDGDSPGRAALVHGSGVLYLPGIRMAVAVLGENLDSQRAGEEMVERVAQIIHTRHEEEVRRAAR